MSNKLSKNKQNAKVTVKQTQKKVVKKNKSSSRIGFLFFVLIMFLVILIGTVFSDLQQVFANKNETKELSNKYLMLLEEEASLNSQVIKLQDPEYKARYARENQMYTKDGETILIIIDEEDKKVKEKEE